MAAARDRRRVRAARHSAPTSPNTAWPTPAIASSSTLRRAADRQAADAAHAVLTTSRPAASSSRSSPSTRTSSRRRASSTITTAIRSTMTHRGELRLPVVAQLAADADCDRRLILPVVAVVIRYFSRRLRRIARDVQTAHGGADPRAGGDDRRSRVVKIFGGEDYERERAVGAPTALRNSMIQAVVGERRELPDHADSRGAGGVGHHLDRDGAERSRQARPAGASSRTRRRCSRCSSG